MFLEMLLNRFYFFCAATLAFSLFLLICSWYYSNHNVYAIMSRFKQELNSLEEYTRYILEENFLSYGESLVVIDFKNTPLAFRQRNTDFVFVEYDVISYLALTYKNELLKKELSDKFRYELTRCAQKCLFSHCK